MFQAYPQQGRCNNRKWKFFLGFAVIGFTFFTLLCGLELQNAGRSASRPLDADDLKGMQVRQPFLAATGFEVGFWTRDASAADTSNEVAAEEHVTTTETRRSTPSMATPSPKEHEALLEQLALERQRSAAQAEEIARLRLEKEQAAAAAAERERSAAEAEELARLEREHLREEAERAVAVSTVGGASRSGDNPPATAAEPADVMGKEFDEEPSVVEENMLSEVPSAEAAIPEASLRMETPPRIPESLWREPPGAQNEENSNPAQESSGGAVAQVESPQAPAAVPEKASKEQQQPRITVRTRSEDGGDIVVHIGGPSSSSSDASSGGDPASPPVSSSGSGDASLGSAPAAVEAPRSGIKESLLSSDAAAGASPAAASVDTVPALAAKANKAPETNAPVETLQMQERPQQVQEDTRKGEADAKDSKSKGGQTSSITVNTGSGEIRIQIQNSDYDHDQHEGEEEKKEGQGSKVAAQEASVQPVPAPSPPAPTPTTTTTASPDTVESKIEAAALAGLNLELEAESAVQSQGGGDYIASQESATSGVSAKSAVETQSTPVQDNQGKQKEQQEEAGKSSKSTQITVQSQGQSITIEVRGEQDEVSSPRKEEPATEGSVEAAVSAPVDGGSTQLAAPKPQLQQQLQQQQQQQLTEQEAPAPSPSKQMAPLIPIQSAPDEDGEQPCGEDGCAKASPVPAPAPSPSKEDEPGSYANLALRAR